MEFHVYILHSEKKHRYYTGFSDVPERTLDQHNAGKTPSTKYGIPWNRVWLSIPMSKTEAIRLERKIKKRGAQRFLEDFEKKLIEFCHFVSVSLTSLKNRGVA